MSRIGLRPIKIPSGVKAASKSGIVEISGPLGKTSRLIPKGIHTEIGNGMIVVKRTSDDKSIKALHGLTRAHIANMVAGVTDGFSVTLEIFGVGYKAETIGKNKINFSLGYSKPVEFVLPEGISAEVEEKGTRLIIRGIDKDNIGQTAARIRRLRQPDSYKGKGIRYGGEKLKLKPGKAGAKA